MLEPFLMVCSFEVHCKKEWFFVTGVFIPFFHFAMHNRKDRHLANRPNYCMKLIKSVYIYFLFFVVFVLHNWSYSRRFKMVQVAIIERLRQFNTYEECLMLSIIGILIVHIKETKKNKTEIGNKNSASSSTKSF